MIMSSMDAYDTQVIVDALSFIPDVPDELRTRVSGLQLSHEFAATKRGQVKIEKLLKDYQAPRRDRQEFENEMEAWKKELEDDELSKEELRKVFKAITGSAVSFPQELKKQTVLVGKKTVDIKHGVVWGFNPFTGTKEKLEYNQKEDWKDFKERCIESVNLGDRQKLIPSLTVEKLMVEAEKSGLSLMSLGRLARSFVEAEIPSIGAKVNNLHDDHVSEIFKVIESAIDVDEEIRIVQQALQTVKREPGHYDLGDILHNYLGKQIVLTQLRLGFANTNQEAKDLITKAAEETTMQALYNLVSQETLYFLLQDVQAKLHIQKQKVTLAKMLKEAIICERNHPEWRIKTVMRPPNGIFATVAVGASVNVVNGDVGEEEEEGILQEADDFADQQFQDDEGELFYLTGVKRVQLRQSRAGRSDSQGHKPRRSFSASPYRGKVTMLKKYVSTQPRGRGRGGPRAGSPGHGRPPSPGGRGGGGRGLPEWRRSAARGRPGYGPRPPTKGRTPSRSPGRKRCLRCGSENHLGKSCPRYGKFCTTQCSICKDRGITLFHEAKVCIKTDSFKDPKFRSNSPATKFNYGFQKFGYQRVGKSPSPFFDKSKN